MLAPVFKESSAATTAATAPSPMTLSRYDEWTGTFGTGNNQDANYGLYAFRNPTPPTSGPSGTRASASGSTTAPASGAPLTTVEAMDVGVVAADVARIMSTRYCNRHAAADQDQSAATRRGATGASPARSARASSTR